MFSPPRQFKISFDPFSSSNVGWSSDRLKRMPSAGSSIISNDATPQGQDAGASTLLTPLSCLFSIYIASISHTMIMMGDKKVRRKFSAVGLLTTTSRLLDEFGSTISNNEETSPDKSYRRKYSDVGSVYIGNGSAHNMPVVLDLEEEAPEAVVARSASLKLALQVGVIDLD